MNVVIMGFDINGDVHEQLKRISTATGFGIFDVTETGGTTMELSCTTLSNQALVLDSLEPEAFKEDNSDGLPKHDYRSVKERNKFFNKRR